MPFTDRTRSDVPRPCPSARQPWRPRAIATPAALATDPDALLEAIRAGVEATLAERDADEARARHARRALETAIHHGAALLDALDLPQLAEPGRPGFDPRAARAAVAGAIALLDDLDAAEEDREDDDREQDRSDEEPWLARPEGAQHETGGDLGIEMPGAAVIARPHGPRLPLGGARG